MYKTPFLGKWVSKYYRIPYGIIIPDPKNKSSGEKLGDIVQGYCKPSLLQRIFCSRLWRPKYYKYFDSWEAPKLPELPQVAKNQVLEIDLETDNDKDPDEQKPDLVT